MQPFKRDYLSNSSMQQRPPSAKTRAPASNIHSPNDIIKWLEFTTKTKIDHLQNDYYPKISSNPQMNIM